MKSCRIITLKACAVLLLSAGVLFGCKPISEEKPLPPKEEGSKEIAAAPEPAELAAPATNIEEVKSIESLGADSATPVADTIIATSENPDQVIDDGEDVVTATPAIMRKVQQALVDAGFNPGPVDGVSGAKTVSAIESFQKQNGIPVGKLTKKTLRALGVEF